MSSARAGDSARNPETASTTASMGVWSNLKSWYVATLFKDKEKLEASAAITATKTYACAGRGEGFEWVDGFVGGWVRVQRML